MMVDVPAEIQDGTIDRGQCQRLRDALVNLILNAVDALPAGGRITLRTHAEQRQEDREDQIVEVIDNGTGMSDEVRRRCQEAFFTTKGDQGTGLGLSIVHGTLRRHGGTLEIESAVGQGTTMRFRLPVRRGTAVSPNTPEPEPTARRTLRVLVVDDEPMMREVVSRFLRLDDDVVETGGAARRLRSSSPSRPLTW